MVGDRGRGEDTLGRVDRYPLSSFVMGTGRGARAVVIGVGGVGHYFPFTLLSAGFFFLAAGDALRVELARTAPAALGDIPDFAAILAWTAAKPGLDLGLAATDGRRGVGRRHRR